MSKRNILLLLCIFLLPLTSFSQTNSKTRYYNEDSSIIMAVTGKDTVYIEKPNLDEIFPNDPPNVKNKFIYVPSHNSSGSNETNKIIKKPGTL